MTKDKKALVIEAEIVKNESAVTPGPPNPWQIRFERLEEMVLEQAVLQTYICDKNGFDMGKILEMLFTSKKNVDIIEQNLTDPANLPVLHRIVQRWTHGVQPKKKNYNH